MWVHDTDGCLVNLAMCSSVELVTDEDAGEHVLWAVGPTTNTGNRYHELVRGGEAECRDALGRLSRQLGALKAAL